MFNLHLVSPSAFKSLEFTEKIEVGFCALLIAGLLIILGLTIIKYIGLPIFNGYSNALEISGFVAGLIMTITGIWFTMTYLSSILFVIIICVVVYFISQNW
ncbi:hypothetical protein [Enterococcus sp. AZ103]|uniref:hypothetical protein n=1 Tax=Enterococcus sp. AZ103 TaxID=2774628 RepID=UPI003F23D257